LACERWLPPPHSRWYERIVQPDSVTQRHDFAATPASFAEASKVSGLAFRYFTSEAVNMRLSRYIRQKMNDAGTCSGHPR